MAGLSSTVILILTPIFSHWLFRRVALSAKIGASVLVSNSNSIGRRSSSPASLSMALALSGSIVGVHLSQVQIILDAFSDHTDQGFGSPLEDRLGDFLAVDAGAADRPARLHIIKGRLTLI